MPHSIFKKSCDEKQVSYFGTVLKSLEKSHEGLLKKKTFLGCSVTSNSIISFPKIQTASFGLMFSSTYL